MSKEKEVRLCYTCGKCPAYERSSYCGKCLYARTVKSERKRIAAEVTIKGLSSEIEELIDLLVKDSEGTKDRYLADRLNKQTENLSYVALNLLGKKAAQNGKN